MKFKYNPVLKHKDYFSPSYKIGYNQAIKDCLKVTRHWSAPEADGVDALRKEIKKQLTKQTKKGK